MRFGKKNKSFVCTCEYLYKTGIMKNKKYYLEIARKDYKNDINVLMRVEGFDSEESAVKEMESFIKIVQKEY